MLARKTAKSIIVTLRMQPEAGLLAGPEVLVGAKVTNRLFLRRIKENIVLHIAIGSDTQEINIVC